jgi:diguanylate cyclase (GGDEF)-like protein
MTISGAALPYVLTVSSGDRSETGRASHASERPAALALKAFMTMSRAIAIVAPDGRPLLCNQMFTSLFGDEDLVEHISRDDNRQVTIADGRTFWVESIQMDDGWLISAFDMTDRMAKARTDHLTKLGNRVMFHERLTELLANPATVPDVAVLTIDLDRFKAVNDALGRNVGDALLGLLARRIVAALGPGDIAARLHGDEFGIIQTGQAQPQAASTLATRLVDLLSRSCLLEGQLITVAASVGIALPSADCADPDQILKNASTALARAKEEGRGSHRFFEVAMDEKMRQDRELEIDLRRALALREFSLVYQPQLNLRTSRVTGFEALLRWQCPRRGAVSPVEFIPLAEATGVIVSIGEWVLRTACREAAKWPDGKIVAVNVSAVQFIPGLVATIVSALAESGLEPHRLELEITESVMMDRGKALGILQSLRELGIRVSLDDFGTGYSSLGYLRSFPFDKIKVDQSFVRGVANDASGRAIVRAIASLGQSLGMATVAEGVETTDQLDRITADGCTDVQGYLISRPIPPAQIDDFLASHGATAMNPDLVELVS